MVLCTIVPPPLIIAIICSLPLSSASQRAKQENSTPAPLSSSFPPTSGVKFFCYCSCGPHHDSSTISTLLPNISFQPNKVNITLSFQFPSLPIPSTLNHSKQTKPDWKRKRSILHAHRAGPEVHFPRSCFQGMARKQELFCKMIFHGKCPNC